MRATALLAALSIAGAAGCTGSNATPLGVEPPPTTARTAGAAPVWIPPAGTFPPSASGAASSASAPAPAPSAEPAVIEEPRAQKARVSVAFAGRAPRAWGQTIPGVLTRAAVTEPVMALTFDACGGPGGDGYDAELIDYLKREKVAATLFLTSKWIAAHAAQARALAADPLFEIENHGSAHRPCSVTGRSAYDIRGTRSVDGAIDEIQKGAAAVLDVSGRAPRFYRPGTAYFDDVCLGIAGALGQAAAGFAVNGDGGTGFSRAQVKDALLKAPAGAIVLLHMNHPAGKTAEGVMDAVPVLRGRGTRLVRLAEVALK